MIQKLKNNRGFTATELLVSMGLLTIIAVIAGPNIRDQISNLKVKSVAKDIYSSFQTAKLEAVEENENIVLLFSPAAYSPDGNNKEYEIFMDDGAGGGTAGDMIKDPGESILARITMPKGVSLISAVFTDGSVTTDKVGFNGQGLPANSFSGAVEVRTSSRWYRINLSVAGNIDMQKSADGINWS